MRGHHELIMKKIKKNNFSFFIKKPYVIFEIENFLDKETFEKLKYSFPSEINFPNDEKLRRKKIFDENNINYNNFIDNNLDWKEFLNQFSEKKNVSNMFNFSLMENIKNRGIRFVKKWTTKETNLFSRFFFRKINFTSYFALQNQNQVVYPHTDARTKLVSMIYYISGDIGGGTEFWNVKKNIKKRKNWKNNHLINDKDINEFKADSELIRKSEFIENKLVGFIKTDLSWHSVLDVGKIDKEGHRKTINLFYRY